VQRKFDGADSDRAAPFIEFELDYNTLLSNKSNKEDRDPKRNLTTSSFTSLENPDSRIKFHPFLMP
jgi:hypothetical protein